MQDNRHRRTDPQDAIVGTDATATQDGPNAVTQDDRLTFSAFVEQDGHSYIDEVFTLLDADMDTCFPEGGNGTMLINCD